MVLEKGQEDHISTLGFDASKSSVESLSKRQFVIFTSLVPIAAIFPSRNADAFLPALVIRLFARSLFRKFASRVIGRTVSRIRKPVINTSKTSKQVKVGVSDVLTVVNTAANVVDIAEFLKRTVWDSSQATNTASMTIDNVDNSRNIHTGDINIHLHDVEKNRNEISSTIPSIKIPAKTRLVIDIKFENLSNPGIKKLYGTFGNGNKVEQSGEILVLKNAHKKLRGRSINDLYKDYLNGKKSKYILG